MTTRDEPETPASIARMRRIVGHIAGIPTSTAPAPSASSSPSLVHGSSATRWNGWGYEDTKLFVNAAGAIEISGHRYADVFHGAADRTLPLLRPWAERVIGIDVSRASRALNTQPDAFQIIDPQFSAQKQHALKSFLETLEACGVRVSVAMEDRVRHSHGQTCEEIYRLRNATHLGRIPDAVVWPSNHAHVARIVAEAQSQSDALCLVPHGGGTNVSSALQCNAQEARAIVSLDVRDMRRILLVDKENMVVRVEAGITGLELHERLRNKGLTLGHEPDSWEFSTLGGWVATKASGMKKNLYGNIEDLVVNITMVTPRGTLQRAASVPRVSMGPDIQQAVIGSEGTLGVVTEVTLRVRAYPSCQVYDSLVFPSLAHGIDAMREIVRAQCVPASIRLLDNTQFQLGQALKPSTPSGFLTGVLDFAKKTYVTKVRGFDGTQMCAATVLLEGTEDQVQRQQKQIQAIASRFHGLVGGAESGQRGYFFTYIIAYLRDFALDYYFMSESFETAVPWSNIQQLCEDVTRAITTTANAQHTLVAQPLVACRVTQLYETGAAVYVYYGINYFGIADPLALFHRVEQAAVEAIVANGGSLSHHHGIGQHRRAWLPDAISAPGVAALRGLKQGLDPQNVFAIDNLVVRE